MNFFPFNKVFDESKPYNFLSIFTYFDINQSNSPKRHQFQKERTFQIYSDKSYISLTFAIIFPFLISATAVPFCSITTTSNYNNQFIPFYFGKKKPVSMSEYYSILQREPLLCHFISPRKRNDLIVTIDMKAKKDSDIISNQKN